MLASVDLEARPSGTSITRPGRRCSTSTPWGPCAFLKHSLTTWHEANANLSSPLPVAWCRLLTTLQEARSPIELKSRGDHGNAQSGDRSWSTRHHLRRRQSRLGVD